MHDHSDGSSCDWARGDQTAPIRSSFRVDDEFLEEVGEEVGRARAKFPRPTYTLAALIEEVGELAQAMLHHRAGIGSKEDIRKEAVQVACVALRVAVEGDDSFKLEYTEP